MKITVRIDLCCGARRCIAAAPEVYALDELGYNRMNGAEVPAGLEEQARRGAAACPESAIRLTRERVTAEAGYRAPDLSLLGGEHVRRYLETNGEVGYLWNGAPCLVLTTRGRKSGELRRIAIIYNRVGSNYVLIASKGGSPQHPSWYLNLCAEPRAQIQIKAERIDVIARTADGEERERLWRESARIWPNYDVYTTRTTRRIPLVVLEPLNQPAVQPA